MINSLTNSTNQNVKPWVAEYRARGFVKLSGVFSTAEIDAVRDDYDRIFDNPEILRADSLRAASRKSLITGTVLDRLDPIIDLSPVIHQLTQDPRIIDAAGAAIGEAALLFKDKAIMKPPGAFGYGIHQDFTNWQELPVPPHCCCRCWSQSTPQLPKTGAGVLPRTASRTSAIAGETE